MVKMAADGFLKIVCHFLNTPAVSKACLHILCHLCLLITHTCSMTEELSFLCVEARKICSNVKCNSYNLNVLSL